MFINPGIIVHELAKIFINSVHVDRPHLYSTKQLEITFILCNNVKFLYNTVCNSLLPSVDYGGVCSSFLGL